MAPFAAEMTTFHEADKLDRIFEDRKREGRKPRPKKQKHSEKIIKEGKNVGNLNKSDVF